VLASSAIPAHVPRELYWDHDITTFASELDDPYVAIARMHDGPDIVWARGASHGSPGWIPTRFELIDEIFKDPSRFSSTKNIDACDLLGVQWRLNPLEIDPPAHTAYRMLLQPLFSPHAVKKMEPMLRQIAAELMGKFENSAGCEFIGDFASLFPSYVFLSMMGLPRDQLKQFLEWEHAFIRSPTMEGRVAGARAIKEYLEGYIERRRSDHRDDIVSAILDARIDGRSLNQGEVMGMCMVLYFGGLDTVMSSMGWYFKHLAENLELQARLRRTPSDIPGAVEDLLRAYGVVGTRRHVKEDLNFHGVEMKRGDVVLLPGFLASRDARVYENPNVVDPDRKARHLTLASGIHYCLGAHLGRLELRIVLEEWLSRFGNIRVPADQRPSWTTQGVWAVTHLPLTWDR
jgi:cytochrome P450